MNRVGAGLITARKGSSFVAKGQSKHRRWLSFHWSYINTGPESEAKILGAVPRHTRSRVKRCYWELNDDHLFVMHVVPFLGGKDTFVCFFLWRIIYHWQRPSLSYRRSLLSHCQSTAQPSRGCSWLVPLISENFWELSVTTKEQCHIETIDKSCKPLK